MGVNKLQAYTDYWSNLMVDTSGEESTFTDIQLTEYENKYFGLGGKVVLALASTIRRKPLSVINYNNFFISPELIYHSRKKYGILSLGTV